MGKGDVYLGLPVLPEEFYRVLDSGGFERVQDGLIPRVDSFRHPSGVSFRVYEERGEPSGNPTIGAGGPFPDREGCVVKRRVGLEDPLRCLEGWGGEYICTKVRVSLPEVVSDDSLEVLAGLAESFPGSVYAVDGGVRPLSELAEKYGIRR
ncbi:MAG: hypothetical protein ACLFO2_03175 [Candidatus Woesearchaeota archaeon]